MEILKLVMGDDDKGCLLCRYPSGRFPKTIGFPWLLCPVHYGDLAEDEVIMKTVEEAEKWKEVPSHE